MGLTNKTIFLARPPSHVVPLVVSTFAYARIGDAPHPLFYPNVSMCASDSRSFPARPGRTVLREAGAP